jgi:5-methylthioribose kinase
MNTMAMVTLSKRHRFFEVAPKDAFFLDTDVEQLNGYLRRRGWGLKSSEFVTAAEIAGQGNMNYIVRVTTNLRTFILKQARPWVEKYPDIAAPFDRALVEGEFYSSVRHTAAAMFMPTLHWVDEQSRILCLEDVGTLGDYTSVYGGVPIQSEELEHLCCFLSFLHCSRSQLANREMRALNHFHIFLLPFQSDNNIDLERFTPGLQAVAANVKGNQLLGRRAAELGQIYLSEAGGFLLHGDYFPGSWLRGGTAAKVIDPEFGFGGPREFDLGVMFAHLLIAGVRSARAALGAYAHWKDLDQSLVCGFAGVEILRRLLGVAQLPITFDLKRKKGLIEDAVHLVLG